MIAEILDIEVKNYRAKIARRNTIYNAADKATKRIMIARDVLERLDDGQYNASTGAWANISDSYILDKNLSVQKCIVEDKIECSCCGVGSLLLSTVVFQNNITIENYNTRKLDYFQIRRTKKDMSGMTKVFTHRQLTLIETAFEMGRGYNRRDNSNWKKYITPEEFDLASDKYCEIDSEDNRLAAIMKNIIRNKGTFVL